MPVYQTLSFSSASSDGSFDSPASSYSCRDNPSANIEPQSPVVSCHRLALKSNKYTSTSVVSLLKWCSPPTILRTVVSVVVYSVDRFSLWSISHIREKVTKRIVPSITDFNPAFSVNIIFSIVRVIASLPQTSPSFMLRSTTHAMRFMANPVYMIIFFNATTRCCVAACKITASYSGFSATITKAFPRCRFNAMNLFSNGEAVESLTDSINNFCHNNLRKITRRMKMWQADTESAFQSLNLATQSRSIP